MKVTGKSSRRTVRGPATLRKRFRAALGLADMTQADFAAEHKVTQGHLSQVLSGFRESGTLTEKIEAFIGQHLVQQAS